MIAWWRVKNKISRQLRRVERGVKGVYGNFKRKVHVREVRKMVKEDGNGIFYTHQVLEDAHWYDFHFVSMWDGKPTAWNATIETTKMAYYEKVKSIAYNESWEAWPNRIKRTFDFERIEGSKYFRMVNHEPEISKRRREYEKTRQVELYESGQVRIAPWHFKVDESYRWGTGLTVHLNVPFINEEVINAFIKEFSEYGRNTFWDRDNTPISMSMDEVGVYVDEESGYIIWNDGTSGESVAMNIDIDEAE